MKEIKKKYNSLSWGKKWKFSWQPFLVTEANANMWWIHITRAWLQLSFVFYAWAFLFYKTCIGLSSHIHWRTIAFAGRAQVSAYDSIIQFTISRLYPQHIFCYCIAVRHLMGNWIFIWLSSASPHLLVSHCAPREK